MHDLVASRRFFRAGGMAIVEVVVTILLDVIPLVGVFKLFGLQIDHAVPVDLVAARNPSNKSPTFQRGLSIFLPFD